MHFLAILRRVNVRRANLQRSSRANHPRPRRQFVPIRRSQQIQLIFHRQYRAVRRHQRIRRIPARAVRNRAGHSRMKIIVLLRQLRAKRHANRGMTRRHFHQLRAQMLHQSLPTKALPHPARKLSVFRVKPCMVFHKRSSIPAALFLPQAGPRNYPVQSGSLFLAVLNPKFPFWEYLCLPYLTNNFAIDFHPARTYFPSGTASFSLKKEPAHSWPKKEPWPDRRNLLDRLPRIEDESQRVQKHYGSCSE